MNVIRTIRHRMPSAYHQHLFFGMISLLAILVLPVKGDLGYVGTQSPAAGTALKIPVSQPLLVTVQAYKGGVTDQGLDTGINCSVSVGTVTDGQSQTEPWNIIQYFRMTYLGQTGNGNLNNNLFGYNLTLPVGFYQFITSCYDWTAPPSQTNPYYCYECNAINVYLTVTDAPAVLNQIPSGGSFVYVTAVGLNTSVQVFQYNVTGNPNGPPSDIECYVHIGKVSSQYQGAPWTPLADIPMTWTGTIGQYDVFSATVIQTNGYYQFIDYCTFSGSAGVYCSNCDGNVLLDISQSFTLSFDKPWVVEGETLSVSWIRVVSGSSNDLVGLMTSSGCPNLEYAEAVSTSAAGASGSLTLSVPNDLVTSGMSSANITFYYFTFVTDPSTPGAVKCTGNYYIAQTSASVTVYSNSGPPAGNGGLMMHFSYNLLFPTEAAWKRQLIPSSSNTIGTDSTGIFNAPSTCSSSSSNPIIFTLYSWTVEVWIKSIPFFGCCSTLFEMTGVNGGIMLLQISTQGSLLLTLDNVDISAACHIVQTAVTSGLADDTWHHVAVSFDSSGNIVFYKDGTPEVINLSDCGSPPFNPTQVRVGSTSAVVSADQYEKYLDEFRFWNVVRTRSQVVATKDRHLFDYEIDSTLQMYYDFDLDATSLLDYTGTITIPDLSTHAFNLQTGYENVASANTTTFSGWLFQRRMPLFEPSTAPIVLSSPVATIYKPAINDNLLHSFNFTIPVNYTNDIDTIILSLPNGVSISDPNDVNREPVTTLPATIQGSTVTLTFNASESLDPSSFTYQLQDTLTSLLAPPIQANILVETLSAPQLGSAGNAMFCSGQDHAVALDFILPVSESTGFSAPYTVEFWSWNFYANIAGRLGTVYSFGDYEILGGFCGDHPYCIGRSVTHFADTYIQIYNGWDSTTNSGYLTYDVSPSWGEWTHIAISSSGVGGNLNLFVNGEFVSRVPDYGIFGDAYGLYLCHWPYYGENLHAFEGYLDEFRVWNYNKTQIEIQELQNLALIGDEPGLLAYYNFDTVNTAQLNGYTYQFYTDVSNNGNDLILGGCTPNEAPWCSLGNSNCTIANSPQVPCYGPIGQTNSDYAPSSVSSSAPVGGNLQQTSVAANDSRTVEISLAGIATSSQTVYYTIPQLPTRGSLLNNNTLATVGSFYNSSTFTFKPAANEGGDPYATVFFAAADAAGNTARTVSLVVSVPCSAGTFLEAPFACVPCPVGQFSTLIGYNSNCTNCTTNTFANATGSTECFACPTGSYAANDGASSCTFCSNVFSLVYCEPTLETLNLQLIPSQVVFAITIILIAIALGFGVVIIIYRNTPIIKASSPIFCLLIIFGCITMYCTSFLYIIYPSTDVDTVFDASCAVRPWIYALGLGLVLGNLLAKTWRVFIIFEFKFKHAYMKSSITISSLVTFSALVLSLEFLFPLIWTAADRPKMNKFYSGTFYYYECQSSNPTFEHAMIACFVVVNALLLIFGSFLAFRTRKVASTFRESQTIAFSFYNILLVGGVFLLIVFLANASFTAVFFIRSFGIMFSTTCTLFAMFAAKIYVCLFDPEKNVATTKTESDSEPRIRNNNIGVNSMDSSLDINRFQPEEEIRGIVKVREDKTGLSGLFDISAFNFRECELFVSHGFLMFYEVVPGGQLGQTLAGGRCGIVRIAGSAVSSNHVDTVHFISDGRALWLKFETTVTMKKWYTFFKKAVTVEELRKASTESLTMQKAASGESFKLQKAGSGDSFRMQKITSSEHMVVPSALSQVESI